MKTNTDYNAEHIELSTLSINMYDQPYTENMSLSHVCKIAEERLKVLKQIQHFFEKRKTDEFRDIKFYDSLSNEFSKSISLQTKIFNSKKDDLASHWVLKLAFADSLEEDNFFIFYEKILFAARLYSQATKRALEHCNLTQDSNFTSEAEDFRSENFFRMLCDYADIDFGSTNVVSRSYQKKTQEGGLMYVDKLEKFLMVPFRFALKAMENYDVELKNGRCQITPYTSFMVLQDLFEECLKIHRDSLKRKVNDIYRQDGRMVDIVESIKAYKEHLDSNIESFYDKKEKFENMSVESIYVQAKNYFPLCMLEIFDSFKSAHTLKHMGRLQFGMFLKGLGMDVKETIRLFTMELKRTGKGEKQVKEYVYYIEHMYGMQGKKTDYAPWSCQKIMGKSPGTNNESWGCPYVYYSEKSLSDALIAKRGLKEEEVADVIALKHTDPTLACRKVFEITHPGATLRKGIGKHPNSYFSSSYWYHERGIGAELKK